MDAVRSKTGLYLRRQGDKETDVIYISPNTTLRSRRFLDVLGNRIENAACGKYQCALLKQQKTRLGK